LEPAFPRLSVDLGAVLAIAIRTGAATDQIATAPDKSSLSITNQTIDSQLLIEIEKRERPLTASGIEPVVRTLVTMLNRVLTVPQQQ
jgi:hypothetical protein